MDALETVGCLLPVTTEAAASSQPLQRRGGRSVGVPPRVKSAVGVALGSGSLGSRSKATRGRTDARGQGSSHASSGGGADAAFALSLGDLAVVARGRDGLCCRHPLEGGRLEEGFHRRGPALPTASRREAAEARLTPLTWYVGTATFLLFGLSFNETSAFNEGGSECVRANAEPRPEVAPRRDPDNPAAGSARTRRMLEDRLTTAGGPLGNSRPPIGDRSTTARGHLGDRSRIIRQLLSLDDCSTTPRGARTSEGSFLSGEKSSPEKHGHGRAYVTRRRARTLPEYRLHSCLPRKKAQAADSKERAVVTGEEVAGEGIGRETDDGAGQCGRDVEFRTRRTDRTANLDDDVPMSRCGRPPLGHGAAAVAADFAPASIADDRSPIPKTPRL
ncbi:hypothetical protein HPB47_008046 [Ixodes persulcatus]|uniref:Uncharacterized protein n=1 Tax=Ixodes persulcatus TaxID=34615 RepID=A0AC60P5N3_IXOPE|nr:hypothetical protein HPB47_008046 [Ixodes persulcatus]